MTKLSRRNALKLGLGGLGAAGAAAACSTTGGSAYCGKVAFNHGVASGDPMQGSVILWTRVTPEGAAGVIPVRWTLARDPQFKTVIRRGVVNTGPERDSTVKVEVDGLSAGQVYYYWFSV